MKIFKSLMIMVLAGLAFSMLRCTKNETTQDDSLVCRIDLSNEQQVIRNFGASDAWSCQFVGKNWPVSKRNKMADLLFSTELGEDGNPKGIGLSLWRFNIGAGTAEQGSESDINEEWRRAESFINSDSSYNWDKQKGQQWFLHAAKERGVDEFVAFVNSPPVIFTKNGKGYSDAGNNANLKDDAYDDFADFMATVVQHFTEQGIGFDYVSPVNEPQWNWDNPGQEGSSYRNEDIYKIVGELNQSLNEKALETKIEIPEAGRITDLYQNDSLPERNHQLYDFFKPSSKLFLGDLKHVAQKVAAHSYFTTYPETHLKEYRQLLHENITNVDRNLEFWMSEYCILEDNPLIKGGGRDLSMDPAIYLAKVIHYDLTSANASAWQWWIAISPYDYKDGLIYIDKDKFDGEINDSKMLWALGNFSRFIRPGMRRVAVSMPSDENINKDLKEVYLSAYHNENKLVIVMINSGYESRSINIDAENLPFTSFKAYVTNPNEEMDLAYDKEWNINEEAVKLSPRSVTTLVSER